MCRLKPNICFQLNNFVSTICKWSNKWMKRLNNINPTFKILLLQLPQKNLFSFSLCYKNKRLFNFITVGVFCQFVFPYCYCCCCCQCYSNCCYYYYYSHCIVLLLSLSLNNDKTQVGFFATWWKVNCLVLGLFYFFCSCWWEML